MSGYILIPVEVKARELHAKTYLALMAAAEGWSVVLAHSVVLQQIAQLLPPSIYLEKNVFPARESLFRDLRQSGHRIVAWDEEAIAVFNYDWYVAKNVQPHMLDLVDRFLTWGERDRDEISRRCPGQASRLVPTGNPRADLLRPEFRGLLASESRTYREQFGDYLLLLSNFSRVNTYGAGIEDYVANVTRVSKLDSGTSAYFLGALRHMQSLFGAFCDVLPHLSAAFPDRQIVVRPHPAEIMDTWTKAAAGLSNVHVVREGTAVGWIDGSAALIHNGCTTGIEAFLMGRLPIAYRPLISADYDIAVPNALSLDAGNVDDLISVTRSEASRANRLDIDRSEYCSRVPVAASIVCSTSGRFAAERILDVLDECRPANSSGRIDLSRIRRAVAIEDAKAVAARSVKQPLRRLKNGILGRAYVSEQQYNRQKFEGADLDELVAFKRELTSLRPGVSTVSVAQITHDCFLFEPGA